MKKVWINITAFAFAVALLAPASLLAQKDEKEEKEIKQTAKDESAEDKKYFHTLHLLPASREK